MAAIEPHYVAPAVLPYPPQVVLAPPPPAKATLTLTATFAGLLLAVMVQTGTMIWWASGIEHRVAAIESTKSNFQDQSVALGKIEQSLTDLIARFDRFENKASLSRLQP